MKDSENSKVTPWEVSGRVDYDKIMTKFGTEPIDQNIMNSLSRLTGGDIHFMLRRGIFFTHRDLGWLLDQIKKGENFYLYTGRGPSDHTHIGHLVPWVFTKWLQDKFHAKLIFQLTDDEKFLFNENLDTEKTHSLALDNALDIVALGFDPKLTEIMIDTDRSGLLYPQAIKIAKKITFSTIKATFGFDQSANIGMIFYTSIQSVPAMIESVRAGKNIPCLIPYGIDQDPHFRIARDVLPRLGFLKPASIMSIFIPPLSGVEGKMSSSDPNSAIFVTDSASVVKRKINKYAFSGGRTSVEEHRKLGGNPDIDVSYQWLRIMFEPDDAKLKKIRDDYISGSLLSGEMKALLIERVNAFLKRHQELRERAKDTLHEFLAEH
ncbi:MAG: tryptophan--tRNA ligase [Candidatus Thermoplasmatota archaeon]|nr:tryptophan--tRNA ligase [Candidatus Thermoplasmatota archaeon]